MTFLFWLGLLTLAIYSLMGLDLVLGNRTIRFLRDILPELPPHPPRVSVIVAARNEERNIRTALSSLLALDYPDYELIVVDDRSTDRTGGILKEMTTHAPNLGVVNVAVLPPGWLGKNHALWIGSRRATGELLLFTDADIVMAPSTLARAVAYLLKNGIDHLTVTPETHMPGIFLNMFGASFILFFSLFARPWKARDPKSSCHIGIGAFNLVRAEAYRQAGGHEAIRMRPDDDMKLGKIVKQRGFRQDILYGAGFLNVEWYATIRGLVRGLEKNAFAGADYRIALICLGIVFHCLASVFPFIALFVTRGPARAVYAAVAVLIFILFLDSARYHNAKGWYVIGFPLTALLFAWILLRTMALNLIQGGITWRGNFYPLAELKKNRV
jgi:glycosyltransferase involved in cell wall biosynthesis